MKEYHLRMEESIIFNALTLLLHISKETLLFETNLIFYLNQLFYSNYSKRPSVNQFHILKRQQKLKHTKYIVLKKNILTLNFILRKPLAREWINFKIAFIDNK